MPPIIILAFALAAATVPSLSFIRTAIGVNTSQFHVECAPFSCYYSYMAKQCPQTFRLSRRIP
jgi:hypothetical protein